MVRGTTTVLDNVSLVLSNSSGDYEWDTVGLGDWIDLGLITPEQNLALFTITMPIKKTKK